MFYVIEKSSQLQHKFGDCFIKFISKNNNFHPALTDLSLIYIRPLDERKGYILCLEHTESFNLNKNEIIDWLINNTGKLWVLDKKEALHWVYPLANKLYDVQLLEYINLKEVLPKSFCINYYYSHYFNLNNINCIIPISKHYEECESIFNTILPIIQIHHHDSPQFHFNNGPSTEIFYNIEKNGIKLDKTCFIDYYRGKLHHPEFNLLNSRIYTQYNLYNTTSRPSNTFNSINFAALNKDNGERKCYKPNNNSFIELDIQGYHPRLIGERIGFPFSNDKNTYESLSSVLGVTPQEAKELTFKQLYGGIWDEYLDKPFFKEVAMFVDNLWDKFQNQGYISTENKIFTVSSLDNINPQKLLNYVVQSYETSTNVKLLEKIMDYLKDKKTKIVLYTYDAFLFDYDEDDGDIFPQIIKIIQYPVSIKQGKSYHGLTKI